MQLRALIINQSNLQLSDMPCPQKDIFLQRPTKIDSDMNIRVLTVWNGDVRFWSDWKTCQNFIIKFVFIASIFYFVKVKSTEECHTNQIMDELTKKCIGNYTIIDFANMRLCALIIIS